MLGNKPTASVCLGCYNRIPRTRWLRNNKDLFLAVLEAEKSMIKALADLVSVGKKFIEDIFSLCCHMAEVARDFSFLLLLFSLFSYIEIALTNKTIRYLKCTA